MKKFIFLLIILCAAGIAANIRFGEKQVLRIGVECDYVPNSWLEDTPTDTNYPIANDPEHYAEGYDIQIAKLVAQEMDVKLEVYKVDWDDLFYALNHGDIDAIFSGMLDTKPRRQIAAFSEIYDAFDNEYTIIVDKNSVFANARRLSDFSGAKIVGQKGTHLDEVIDQIDGVVHLPAVESVTISVNMVAEHKADGAVINYDTGQPYLRKHRNLKMIRFREGDGFYLDFNGTCAAVRKNDTDLLAGINNALRKIPKWDRQRIMDRSIAKALHNIPQ